MRTSTQSPSSAGARQRMAMVIASLVAILGAGILTLISVAPAAAATLPASTCTLAATTRTCDLYATTGMLALTASPAVSAPIWGYSSTATPGSATLPGPVLIANENETLNIILHNVDLPQATSLSVAQQSILPDVTGVTAGNSKTYTLSNLKPGTYLYEAGLTADGPRQVAMGLFGALIVRPAANAGWAYTAQSAFDDEALVILSEIDPAFNANPTGFQMSGFAPKYWLINGKVYPNTDPIATDAAHRVLLRYLNAGLLHHSMALAGVHEAIVAIDGKPATNPTVVVAQTIPTGSTLDAIVTVPAGVPGGTRYPVFDGAMHLDNNGVRSGAQVAFGGMLTFLTTAAGSSGPSGGPVTSNVAIAPNPNNGTTAATLSALLTASAGANLTDAEYFVDAIGANGAGCQFTPLPTGATANLSMAIPTTGGVAPCTDLGALASGNHTFFVHGRDSSGAGTWGAVASTVLNLDKTGPAIGNTVASPSLTNGSVDVSVQATASDAASGNQNVTAAEYFIDSQPDASVRGTALTLGTGGPIVSVSTTLAAATVNGLTEGAHTIFVRAQDSLGNWGAFGGISLTLDRTGPATSGVSTTPNPTAGTGTSGIQCGTFTAYYQRIDATSSDPISGGVNSNIVGAEYFFDTVGPNGTGGVMLSSTGQFNSPNLQALVCVELYNIQSLVEGSHTIYVHAKDAAGNWGPTGTTTLVIDRTGPTVSGLTVTPVVNTSTAAINATATDPVVAGVNTNIAAAEYFIDTATTNGAGVAMTVSPPNATTASLNATIPAATMTALPAGNHSVLVHARDQAGNWSALVSAPLPPPDLIFANGFEAGTFAGWSATSTTSTTRMNVTAAAALVGTRGMQAQGNSTNYVQNNFSPAAATYDARFHFRPNGNTATGQDIFRAATSSGFGTVLFRVRYRLNAGQAQVQIQIGTGTTNTVWTNINGGADNVIEVVWQAVGSGGPNPGTLALTVNGATTQTLTTTSTGAVAAVRLGSVANGTSATLEYFDAFASKRSVTPLLGP